jgi:hypothetical protein
LYLVVSTLPTTYRVAFASAVAAVYTASRAFSTVLKEHLGPLAPKVTKSFGLVGQAALYRTGTPTVTMAAQQQLSMPSNQPHSCDEDNSLSHATYSGGRFGNATTFTGWCGFFFESVFTDTEPCFLWVVLPFRRLNRKNPRGEFFSPREYFFG